jgi:HAD superfamily hydrolase (TIGR01509 family)
MSTLSLAVPGRGPAAAQAAATEIDAVIFDMDGLLLNTEALAARALALAGKEVGIDTPRNFCESLIGVPADDCRRLLLDRYGQAAPADAFFAAATRHLNAMIDRGLLELRPGAEALLRYLDQCGMPRAVATSSSREKAAHHLAAARIADRFDAIVTRDDVARGKPHPDLYLCAAVKLGVKPSRCLALEDSYNGVRAAHAAAVPVIMVPDLLPPTAEMRALCAGILEDLGQAISWLAARGSRSPCYEG